jgi:uncharacterized coiled-coil DUF342 family protein
MAQAPRPTQHWGDLDDGSLRVESAYLSELQEQKNELLSKVTALKTDLQDWRSKLDAQVKSYKTVC